MHSKKDLESALARMNAELGGVSILLNAAGVNSGLPSSRSAKTSGTGFWTST